MTINRRMPLTNGDVSEISALLPQSINARYFYMIESAIIDIRGGHTSDHSFNTEDEIRAYAHAYSATLTWMAHS